MKIKLKVKTIIVTITAMVFILVVAAPLITYEIAYILHSRESAKAGVFYNAYFSYPVKFNEDKALYEMANHVTGGLYKYKLFTQMQGSISDVSSDDMIKSKEALERILYDFEDSEYYLAAYSKIMDLNLATQDVEELLQWIEWGKVQENKELAYISDLYRAYYLFANKDYDGASQILELYGEDKIDSRYDYLIGNLHAFTSNEELAIEHFNKAVESKDYNYTLFGSPTPNRRNEWYRDYIADLKGNHKIRGKVSYDGEPMPFVEIYVQKESSGYSVGYTDLIGITDINGEFETLGLRSGRYDIGIGINPSIAYDKVYLKENIWVLELNNDMVFDFKLASPMEILSPETGTVVEDGKFTVSWEPVDNAEYYQIQTVNFFNPIENTGVFRTTIRDSKGNINIKGTTAEIDIRKLSKFVGVIGYDGDENNLKVLPTSILGLFSPGSEYSIMVNAFDSNGNMVGSSIPLIKFYDELATVQIKGQISIGENYILKGNYEEAINHYEVILEREPNNEEALIYLSKIYGFGWENRSEYIENAIEYGNRYMDVYDDGSLLLTVIGSMSSSSKLKYSDIIHKAFEKIPLDERGSDYYYELGRFKSLLGEYEAAREAYKFAEDYIPTDVLYMDLYLGELDQAIDRLEDYRLSIIKMSKGILKTNLMEIDEYALESEDYTVFKEFLDEIISGNLKREEKRELFSKTVQSINNKNIKAILNQIRLEEYLDQNY